MMIDLSSLSIQLCIAKHSKGVKPELLSVPSEGPHALAGESPARVKAGSNKLVFWGRTKLASAPSEGSHVLAGESPARVRAGSPEAWIAGGDGNVAF